MLIELLLYTQFLPLSSSPVVAPNLLLALVGIACATTFTSHSSGVLSTEPISAWSYIHLLQLTIQGVQSLIMGNELEHFTEHPVTALLSVRHLSVLTYTCSCLVTNVHDYMPLHILTWSAIILHYVGSMLLLHVLWPSEFAAVFCHASLFTVGLEGVDCLLSYISFYTSGSKRTC